MKTGSTELARRSGLAVAAGAVIAAAGIAAELFHRVEDGNSVENVPLFVLYLGSYALGMGLLALGVVGLRRLHAAEGVAFTRAGRLGFRLVLAGTIAQVAFAAVMVTSALATGETVGAAFLLFALGFLALIVGQVLLAVALRRGGIVGLGWIAPLAGVVTAAVAIGTPVDPLHDLALFLYFGSWVALGAVLAARAAAGRGSTMGAWS
jgi:drug/metabolite transporter (DMT)-like permease